MANFCENCGSPLKNDNKFCPNCGAPVKDAGVATPVTSGAADAPQTNAVTPSNSPSTAAAPDTASAAFGTAGSAAAATVGALHPEPAPEKPQESFVPPQQQPYAMQRNFNEETGPEKKSVPPSLNPESRQDIPHQDYYQQTEFAKGSAGPKYEPDTDFQSKFLRYDNRLNRKRYIMRALTLWAAVVAVSFIIGFIASVTGIKSLTKLGTIVSIASVIPGFMLVIRRLHDLDRPTWWCLGCIIPLINFVLAIYLLFFKGTDGPNQYGPDPLEVQD